MRFLFYYVHYETSNYQLFLNFNAHFQKLRHVTGLRLGIADKASKVKTKCRVPLQSKGCHRTH